MTIRIGELIQIIPCQGLLAVWVLGRSEGVMCEPISFLGLAKCDWIDEDGEVYSEHNEIVALQLENGEFEVCERCNNFAGLIHQGASPLGVNGRLSSGKYMEIAADIEHAHRMYEQASDQSMLIDGYVNEGRSWRDHLPTRESDEGKE